MIQVTPNQDRNLLELFNENMKINKSKINIGGDHSMSIATVASSLRQYKNLKVIWFDAHPDINTRISSKTKNMHGMPLSFLSKLDNRQFFFKFPQLRLENIMYIGIREFDTFERKIIDEFKIKVIDCHEVNSYPEKSFQKIKNFIKNDPVHLSFDVDSIDPKFIFSTGTKVDKGLKIEQTRYLLNKLLKENLVNIDLVELNLDIGTEEQQQESIYNIFKLFENYLTFKNDH